MKNAEWMIEQGMEFSKLVWGRLNGKNIVYYDPVKHFVEPTEPPESAKELYSEKSANTENLILKWLDMEHKEPILDEVEKRYLKSVIKPFVVLPALISLATSLIVCELEKDKRDEKKL